MYHKLLLAIGLLTTYLQAFAQPTFNGYYIDNNGDTTAVSFPAYKQWKDNPSQIEVRTAGGQDRVLTPENTREVTIEGYDTYRSRRFKRLTNPYEFTNFNDLSPVDSSEEIHGFLLFLAQGDGVSLYKYSDPKRANFFIEKEGVLTELKHKIYPNEFHSAIIEDNRFRQQLWTAFIRSRPNDGALKHRLETLQYREEQLEAFVKGIKSRTEKKVKRYPPEFAFMGGIAYNTFKVTSPDLDTRSTRADYKGSVAPVLAVGFYEYSQRGFGSNFFTLQLKYYRFKNSGDYTYYSREGTATYSANVFNLGIGMGRNFIQKPGFKAYAAVVPYLVFMPDSKEQFSDYNREVKESFFAYNFSVQAGVRFGGRLGAWAHYNLLSTDVMQYIYYNDDHRSLQVGVAWWLKRQK